VPAPAAPGEREEAAQVGPQTAARRDAETRQVSDAITPQGALSGVSAGKQAAKKPAPANALPANVPAAQRASGTSDVASARLEATGSALPPPAEDASLATEAWIARIRARLQSGDHAGAAASLKSFMHAHPDAAIPDDLQPLLH
jgi:hypothetical protein